MAMDTDSTIAIPRNEPRVGTPSDSPSLVLPTPAPSKKEKKAIHAHNYYIRHRERELERRHQYYINNQEQILTKAREYGIRNKERRHRYNVRHRKQHAEWARNYKLKHPEYGKESSAKQNLALKIKVLNMIGGAKCIGCGTTEIRVLEVNHIGGGGTKDIIQYKKRGIKFYKAIIDGERSTDGLNVLCAICNRLEYIERKYPDLAGKFSIQYSESGF